MRREVQLILIILLQISLQGIHATLLLKALMLYKLLPGLNIFRPVIKDTTGFSSKIPYNRVASANFVRGLSSNLEGTLHLYNTPRGVTIIGQVGGLLPGNHGFHIHEFGATSNQCLDAGNHFNPFQTIHGSPVSRLRHVGDLGNINANRFGIAYVNILDDVISLDPTSPAYVGGLSFVIDENPDDLTSSGNGNSGGRLGCAIINNEITHNF